MTNPQETTMNETVPSDLGAIEDRLAANMAPPEEALATAVANSPAGAATPLDRLKGRREELRQERHTDIPIPGYGGELVARFRPVSWDELRVIGRKLETSKSPRRELLAQADTLIAALEAFFIRVNGELESADPEGDGPVRFDRLAELLDIEAETTRQALFEVFLNDLAVTTVHNELAEWMAGSDEEVDEQFVGESQGGPK